MKKQTTEKPILFRTEMVKALCEKRKTVTRRLVSPQPPIYIDWLEYKAYNNSFQGYMQPGEPTVHFTKAKYWPGLMLWVRETFIRVKVTKGSFPLCPENIKDGWQAHGDSEYLYRANAKFYPDDKWNASIFLPRIASRFLLKITDVKIERLHELDDIDAVLEGCKNREDYIRLWNDINGKSGYTWENNPWVYRIQFENMGANYGGN